MSVQANLIPRRRVRKGDWPTIQVAYNAEHCTNKSIPALRSAYWRGDLDVTRAVFDHYDQRNEEVRELIKRAKAQQEAQA